MHGLKKTCKAGRAHGLVNGLWALGLCMPGIDVPGQQEGAIELADAVRVVGEPIADVDQDAELYQPGFTLLETEETTRDLIAQFNAQLDAGLWGEAFRTLTELSAQPGEGLVVMEDGLFRGVRAQLQSRVRGLPADGRRAFRLYFDGQAREQLKAVREHPQPGSDAQLVLAKRLVDRLVASSVGGEAADLLGDLYYERGRFALAARAWALSLEEGAAGPERALRLQTKIVLALKRAGRLKQAEARYQSLRAQYAEGEVVLGGEAVDALELLGEGLSEARQAEPGEAAEAGDRPLVLPESVAAVVWHRRVIDEALAADLFKSSRTQNYHNVLDLADHLPPVVADDDRLYFHWLGVVFALEQASGKVAWWHGELAQTAAQMANLRFGPAGDPRHYQIAQAEQVLLTTHILPQNMTVPFVVSAYDKRDGTPLWRSNTAPGWSIGADGDYQTRNTPSVIGEVVVAGGWGYAVVHPVSSSDYYLKRFDPRTGEVAWTLPLGAADAMNMRYGGGSRMPPPQLLADGGSLYVLMNNAALLAVDLEAGEIAWARRLEPSEKLKEQDKKGQRIFFGGSQPPPPTAINPNGSGGLLMHDGLLYAKEHDSTHLYTIQPITGKLAQAVHSGLEPSAKLIAVSGSHAYLLGAQLQSVPLDDTGGTQWRSPPQTSMVRHHAALFDGDQLLTLTGSNMRLFNSRSGAVQGSFDAKQYLNPNGGRLYRFGDLLVSIDQTGVTAFRPGNSSDAASSP